MAKDKDAAAALALTEEQFFMCIITQLDGKIDWKKVADECGIVSPAAAQKRFSRLKAKHGQAGTGTASSKNASPASVDADVQEEKPKKKVPRKTANKKRKADEAEAEDGEEEKPVKGEEEEA